MPARGNITPNEIRPLALTARRAFDVQLGLGNIDPGEDFDAWRHRQVLETVAKPGLRACSHDDFRPLRAHFSALAGLDDRAFQDLMTTGSAGRDQGDTHEARRVIANQILDALETHQKRGGSISPGYLVATVRRQTSRPRLTLGRDLRAGLAERCTVRQLCQIRATIINRIRTHESRARSGRAGSDAS